MGSKLYKFYQSWMFFLSSQMEMFEIILQMQPTFTTLISFIIFLFLFNLSNSSREANTCYNYEQRYHQLGARKEKHWKYYATTWKRTPAINGKINPSIQPNRKWYEERTQIPNGTMNALWNAPGTYSFCKSGRR